MRTVRLTRIFYLAGEGLLLGGILFAAAWLSRSQEWHPALLVVMLVGLALVGTQLEASVGSGRVTTSHIALVLCMTLLGPAPAVVAGIAVAVVASDPLRRRLSAALWLSNLFTDAAYPFCGRAAGALGARRHPRRAPPPRLPWCRIRARRVRRVPRDDRAELLPVRNRDHRRRGPLAAAPGARGVRTAASRATSRRACSPRCSPSLTRTWACRCCSAPCSC